MSNYKCKCGNEKDFFIEHNLSQCGLYCGECGKWQKWLNKDEERLFKHNQVLADHDKQIRDEVIDDIISKIDDEYYDGGYGDYHEVAMIVRMLEQMKGEQNE